MLGGYPLLIIGGITLSSIFEQKTEKMWKRAIADDFEIVAARCGDAQDYAKNRAMVTLIEAWHPSFWQFINPDLYLVYFRGKLKKDRSDGLASQMKGHPAFANIRIGTGCGRLVTQVTLFGKVVSAPLGEAANQAVRNAQS